MVLDEALRKVTEKLLSLPKKELEKKIEVSQENPFLELFLFESSLRDQKDPQNDG